VVLPVVLPVVLVRVTTVAVLLVAVAVPVLVVNVERVVVLRWFRSWDQKSTGYIPFAKPL
jgi:hypothetical protein